MLYYKKPQTNQPLSKHNAQYLRTYIIAVLTGFIVYANTCIGAEQAGPIALEQHNPELSKTQFFLGAQYFYINYDAEQQIENTSGEALEFGFTFNNNWQLSLFFQNSEPSYEPLSESVGIQSYGMDVVYNDTTLVDHFGYDGVARQEPKFNLIPYWRFGVAHEEINFEAQDDQGDTLARLGFGVKFPVTQNFFINLEALGYYAFEESFANYGLSAGVSYRFGEPVSRSNPIADYYHKYVPESVNEVDNNIESTKSITDQDGDGISDAKDQCPNTQREFPVDATGCMIDSDGDGVTDSQDQCPATAIDTQVDDIGCKVLKREKVVTVKRTLLFGSNLSSLEPLHHKALRKMAAMLKRDPNAILIVETYTDNKESANDPFALAEKRADTIKNVLFNHYHIDPARIQVMAFGSMNPARPNDSAKNRRLNRRAELLITTLESYTR